MEDGCGAVCYPMVKPLLRYFEVCQRKDQKSAELQDSLNEFNLKYSKLLEKHSASQDRCTALQRGLNETDSQNRQLQGKLDEVSRRNARLEAESRNKDEELRTLKTQVAQQGSNINKLQAQNSDLKQEVEELREALKNGSGTNASLLNATAQVEGGFPEPHNAKGNTTTVKRAELAENVNTTQSEYRARNVSDLPDPCSPDQKYRQFVYPVMQLPGLEPFEVSCLAYADIGSRWMQVFVQFCEGLTNFNRTYDQYISGFGSLRRDFFIGLEKLHILTSLHPHEMLMHKAKSTRYNLRCSDFVVGDRSEGYRLKVLQGCHGDLSYFNLSEGTQFSTFDNDQDGNPDHNWAMETGQGFWFGSKWVFDFPLFPTLSYPIIFICFFIFICRLIESQYGMKNNCFIFLSEENIEAIHTSFRNGLWTWNCT